MGRKQASVTILGSGTLLPSADRASAAHLVAGAGGLTLLDCGSGTLHGVSRHGVAWKELRSVGLTHFHNDHAGDLPGLMQALRLGITPPRTDPLTLFGPPGLRAFLLRLQEASGVSILEPGFPVEVVELPGGAALEPTPGGGRVTAHPTPHTEESVALRWEGPEGVVGYTGDTGPSAGLTSFLAGCDVLIAECSQPDPPALDTHLSPRGVAALAAGAQPGLLILTHVFPPLEPHQAVRLVQAAGYAGKVVAGYDGLRVDLGR